MKIKFRLIQFTIHSSHTYTRYKIQILKCGLFWKTFNYEWANTTAFDSPEASLEFIKDVNPMYLSVRFRLFGGMYDNYPQLLQYPTVITHDFKHY